MIQFRRESPLPAMTLEGALGPNRRLDQAEGRAVAAPQALCVAGGGGLMVSSGHSVQLLADWNAALTPWRDFPRPVTALAADASGATIAVGLAGGGLVVCDITGAELSAWNAPVGLKSVVDCQFLPDGRLALLDNGFDADENPLSVAPWDGRRAGQVVVVTRDGESRVLARELHCPMGLALDRNGSLIIAEMEHACLLDVEGRVLRQGLPGYLARLRRTSSGYALACLGRRDPLIEFLKSEPGFIAEMKANIATEHWIAPRVHADFSHDFPIEAGATRLFGEIKPWAPSFSYGLVVELDAALMPVASAHSRADGRRHCISDVVEWGGGLVAVSLASQELLRLDGDE